MIKLIATDMDGTLLNSQGEIDPSFYPTLEALYEKNIIFAAASGRQYYNLLKRFESVKDEMVFIAENGTYVVYKGEELLVSGLRQEDVDTFIEVAQDIPESYIVLCGKKSAYVVSEDERFKEQHKKYYERCEVVKDFKDVDDVILKFTICDFKGSEDNSNRFFETYRDDFQITVSGHYWLDITAKDINKGIAMKKIQEQFGITPEETMVFGDYLNDVELMKSAYHSYAMENGHPDLKKMARFVAKSNDENGVVEMIREKVLMA